DYYCCSFTTGSTLVF
nr:immunoglobulin light chain junction region [Macaca mulatta]